MLVDGRLLNPMKHLARFKVVREKFDPNGIFKSVVGEILGLYDD